MAVNEIKKKIQKKKENVTITISPYLKKQLDEMVLSGDFSSLSDLATIALSEFVSKYYAQVDKWGGNKKNDKQDHPADDYETEYILD